MNVTLINCKKTHRPNHNEELFVSALKQAGHQVTALAWDDLKPNHQCDVALFRLVWDYVDRLPEFMTWLDDFENHNFTLYNDIKTIRWNLKKTYLLELQSKGIRIPKTYVWQGQYLPNWIELEKNLGPAPYVFKPIVSAAARGTFMVHGDVSYSAAIDRMKRAPFIAQKYLREVKNGEVSLIYFAGQYSHAVKKIPQPGDFRVQSDFGGSVRPYEASSAEIDWGLKVIGCAPADPLIARVDYVISENEPTLMELEVFEPELFFNQSPGSAEKLVRALESRTR